MTAPYLTLMTEAAPQRDHSRHELFNGLRYVIGYGIAWRAMPNDFPPWAAVYQQSQRWLADPTAAIINSRTLRSTPESGTRAGYDGAKRKRGSTAHMVVDTLGHLSAPHVMPADVGDRAAVARLAADVQDATGETAASAAAAEGIALHVVKLPEAKRGVVLLPRRWVVDRWFAWATRCRRWVKDYEDYASTVAGFDVVAFVGYMLKHAADLMKGA